MWSAGAETSEQSQGNKLDFKYNTNNILYIHALEQFAARYLNIISHFFCILIFRLSLAGKREA